MAEYNVHFDWNRISTLGKVKVLVEQVVGTPSQAQISQAVEDYIESHPGSLSPLSPAVKSALLQIAEKVAYKDENGEDYYDALDAALNAKALLQITAVYTQSGTVYDTDSLDSLKADLVVTAYYDDSTTANVTSAAVLSGTLAEGTSTITATYSGKSATFNVVVSLKWSYDINDGVVVAGGYANQAAATCGMRLGTFDSTRRSFAVESGEQSIAIENPVNTIASQTSAYYPVPMPVGAKGFTVSITPSTQYVQVLLRQLNNGVYSAYTNNVVGPTGYIQGSLSRTFDPHTGKLYLFITSKYNNSGSSYPVEPTNITVTINHD